MASVPVNILQNCYNVLVIIFQVRLWSIESGNRLFLFVDETRDTLSDIAW